MPSLVTTITPINNGVDPTAGQGETKRLTITGTWVVGEEITFLLTDQATGVSFTVGAGEVTALAPVFGMTLDQKSYFVAGSSFYFSDLDSPTVFNEPTNPGNGSVNVANYFSTPENLTALAQYQNGMAVFSTNFIQIWEVSADPESYAKKQTLQNIGTRAKETVRSLGIFDVIFLDDSGFRSLRARESSLDAETVDVGSPIDTLVQASIDSGGSDLVPFACGIVEPRTKMYWGYFNGVIYVLSRFLASKITAWSTFTPSHHTNMIPAGAAYDINGSYLVGGLIVGYTYEWTPGADNSTLTNGAQVLSTAQSFVATNALATLSGGPLSQTIVSTLMGQRAFVIQNFRISGRQVFFRADDGYIYAYGGVDGAAYDKVQVVVETPWLDDGSPTTNKLSLGVDASFAGLWTFSFGMGPETGTLATTWDWTGSSDQNVASTYDKKTISSQDFQGTHFKIKAVSSATSAAGALLSALHLKYKMLETT